MKKVLAILMAITLVITAAALPGFAEETGETTDQISSATQAKGGNSNGRHQKPGSSQAPGQNSQIPGRNNQTPGQSSQMPGRNNQAPGQSNQMPGRNNQAPGQNSQTPAQNSQVPGQDSQTPEQNSQDTQSGQQARPGKNGREANHGKQSSGQAQSRKGKSGMLIDPAQLLDAGIITQEIYDAIVSYLQEHTAQQADGQAAPAEGEALPPAPGDTAPEAGGEPPALPVGTIPAEGSSPDREVEAVEQLLKDLLESGVITQAQYDLFQAMIPQPQPVPEGESSI